jgi:xanthine dehydrogenase accessory factor
VALVVLATELCPRGPGARMVVTQGALAGTIGGGALEYQAVAQARAILAHPAGAWRVQDWPLGPLLGQCCGGRVRLLVEHLDDAAWFDAPTLATLAEARVQRRPLGDAAPAPCPRAAPARPGTTFAEPDDGPLPCCCLARAMWGARLPGGWAACR